MFWGIAHNVLGIRGFGGTKEQCEALRAAKIWVERGVGAFRQPSRTEPRGGD